MKKKKILVVDDSNIVCAAFKAELGKEGFYVDEAFSGEVAVDMARLDKYDLIFVDMVMPGIDGIETCRRLKKITPDSVIVFMTGHIGNGLTAKELKFREAGGVLYYLYKPFVEGEIIEVAKKALGLNREQQKE